MKTIEMGDKVAMAAEAAAAGDDASEGMQCSDHPYGKNAGGICAFCLQEKLGKLVSSSNSSTPFLSLPPPPSSSSSSPSFRSDYGSSAPAPAPAGSSSSARTRVPFLSSAAKKNAAAVASSSTSSALKRSKSVAPARPIAAGISVDSPRKKGFWSFLYTASSSSSSATVSASTSASTAASGNKRRSTSCGAGSDVVSRDLKIKNENQQLGDKSSSKEEQEAAVGESPAGSQASSSSFGRKVARSRSVGCGSRSFSGDFLERISTGFGDCTLRRVESQREPNNGSKHCSRKMSLHDEGEVEQRVKERVKCGGIFGGFGMISSSASSYWLAAAAAAGDEDFVADSSHIAARVRASSAAAVRGGGGRNRSWGWAFTSPIRAFRPAAVSSRADTAVTVTSVDAAAIAGNGGSGKIVNGGSVVNANGNSNPSLLAVGG